MTPLIYNQDQDRCTRGGPQHTWWSTKVDSPIATCVDCGFEQRVCRVDGCGEPTNGADLDSLHSLCERHWGAAWNAEWKRRQLALRKRAAFWIGFAIGAFGMCVVFVITLMVGGER